MNSAFGGIGGSDLPPKQNGARQGSANRGRNYGSDRTMGPRKLSNTGLDVIGGQPGYGT
jgi:hypothetical protein